jgi:hypothetical protein
MPDEDTLDEGGLEPAVDESPVDDGGDVAVEEEPEPETYTREQLAELLGPRFERFASHEGDEAFRQFGQAYDSATGLIRQGAHLEPQDPSVYEQIGLDPSEVQLPEPEPTQGLFGVPWEAPTTWEEINALAQSDHLEHKVTAAEAVVRDPNAPENYKEAYWDNAYGAGAYKQAVMQQQLFQEQQEALREQIKSELLAEIGPLQQVNTNNYVDGMLAQARTAIPGFTDHEAGIALVMQERERKFPGYQEAFNSSDMQTQLAEFQELTLIAASRAQPAQQAAAQAAADATDANKLRSRTETSRTNGQPNTEQAALKAQSLAEAQRVFGQVR